MMALIKGPAAAALHDGSQPSKYVGAAKRGVRHLDVSPSRDSHLAFFDLVGGHASR